MTEWINASDRLPDNQQAVIAHNVDGDVTMAVWCGSHWDMLGPASDSVTHWMPMPAPPRKDASVEPEGWQWNEDRTRLEHAVSHFGFDVPRTEVYVQAMSAVIEQYRRLRTTGEP